jgi:hypothetical protein
VDRIRNLNSFERFPVCHHALEPTRLKETRLSLLNYEEQAGLGRTLQLSQGDRGEGRSFDEFPDLRIGDMAEMNVKRFQFQRTLPNEIQ